MAHVRKTRQQISCRPQEETEARSDVLRIARRLQTTVGDDEVEALTRKRQGRLAVIKKSPRDIQSLQLRRFGAIGFRRHGEEPSRWKHLAQFRQVGEAFHDEHGKRRARRRKKAQQTAVMIQEIFSLLPRHPHQCILRAISRAFFLSSFGV